ncbi:endonuclease/exonuclease/phosphatase family protein [Streptomyces sp. HUAS ZL42]|uniref:endonuclease/exonuclease/phosphatase family protein n=1 Tax=Streptomyces sp. HUAS ZL42 TaxID=3231715 RepID=UPI00345E0D69
MSDFGRLARRTGLRTVVAAAVAAPLVGSVRAAATLHEYRPLRVMTFNLRFASAVEPNSWAARRPVMRALLCGEAPHVIGTQEGVYQQLRDICLDLGPHYDWIGTGREHGSHDESMAVFFDRRRLAPAEYDHFWLSDTPEVIGSNTWGGAHVRMVTWVRFRDLQDDGREFYVLNTHLDNVSQYARTRGAALIAERAAGLDRKLPLMITGDFNAVAHKNPAYDTLLAAGLVDTWDAAAERGAAYGTFHDYKPLTPHGDRIDWILATPGVRIRRAWVSTFCVDGQFPSDHLPVQVTLSLE